jgi:hypothetical protein
MMNQKYSLPFWGILLVIGVAVMSRLLPHPLNMSPLAGIALFGAASLKNRGLAIALPLLAERSCVEQHPLSGIL